MFIWRVLFVKYDRPYMITTLSGFQLDLANRTICPSGRGIQSKHFLCIFRLMFAS